MSTNIADLQITIRDLVDGYVNDDENGVFGYGGKLTIRPAFQREFIYKDKQRDAVIDSVINGYPLGVMYWSKGEDGNYECLDGQQRTISICDYVHNKFSIKVNGYPKIFNNLTNNEKEKILNYKLLVYGFNGTDSEKLEWFKRINTPGTTLNNQELLNAVYTGEWLSDAKRYFSKRGCSAYTYSKGFVKGDVTRQDYLEKALIWAADKDDIKSLEDYMSIHQNDKDANYLWQYFCSIIDWAKRTFPNIDSKLTEKQNWGILFNKWNWKQYNDKELKGEIEKLLEYSDDGEITKPDGIIPYVLSDRTPSDERYLSLRTFPNSMKLRNYNKQTEKAKIDGTSNCPYCSKVGIKKIYKFEEMQGDHIVPWSKGGRTIETNLQMLCIDCNNRKKAT